MDGAWGGLAGAPAFAVGSAFAGASGGYRVV
jgi:hypothetical protein